MKLNGKSSSKGIIKSQQPSIATSTSPSSSSSQSNHANGIVNHNNPQSLMKSSYSTASSSSSSPPNQQQQQQQQAGHSFLSLDDNLSSPTSSSSSSYSSSSKPNHKLDRDQITSLNATMPQTQHLFTTLDSQLAGNRQGGMGGGESGSTRFNPSSSNYEDTPVSPTSSSSTKNTRGSRLGAQMGRKGSISPSGFTSPTSAITTSSILEHQQQSSSSPTPSPSSSSAQRTFNPTSSLAAAERAPSPSPSSRSRPSLPPTGSRNLNTITTGSASDLKGKWKEREQRDLMEESTGLEKERIISRDRSNSRVKGWARAHGIEGIETEEEEYLKESPSPRMGQETGSSGRFQSANYPSAGGGGRVAAMAAKLAASSSTSSSDFISTPPRLGVAMGMRSASSTSATSTSNSGPDPSVTAPLNIGRKEPARSPTWDRQSGSSFGTAITADDWTSGAGNHLSLNSNTSMSSSNGTGPTYQTLAAFSASSAPNSATLSSTSPSTSPPTNSTRRLNRISSTSNLLSDSTATGNGGVGDSSFNSQTSQGTSRGGRLGRLQYNKSDNVSVTGPSNKGWDTRRPSAESRNSLLGRASTPNLASSYRKEESSDSRQSSGDSQTSGNGGMTGASSSDWKGSFIPKTSSPRGSNAGMPLSDSHDNSSQAHSTSPNSNPPSSFKAGLSGSNSTPTSSGPPQQRELLLPALSGVRSAIADLVRPASPLWVNDSKSPNASSPADVLASAREDLQSGSSGPGLGEATNVEEQSNSPDLGGYVSSAARSSTQSHDRGVRRRPPSGTGSDTSGSASKPNSQGGGPNETLTRFAMNMSPLLDSLDSTVGASTMETSFNSSDLTQGSRSTRRPSGTTATASSAGGSFSATSSPVFSHGGQDSPSLGQLSDEAIVRLGALPGTSPEHLLNANGSPLSSKNVLTIALKKAQNAVSLDSANNVPEAITAYQQAVRLLREVMERIAPRNGKRSKASREEERRRLKNIHDTYAERIRLLSMIYSPDEEGQDSDFGEDDLEEEERDEEDEAHSPFVPPFPSSSSSPRVDGRRPSWNDQSFSDPSISVGADSSTSFFASRSLNHASSRDFQSQQQRNHQTSDQQKPTRSKDVMEELIDSSLDAFENSNASSSLDGSAGQFRSNNRDVSTSFNEVGAPRISVQSDSSLKTGEGEAEDQEVLVETKSLSARENGSDSESSFTSVQSNRGLSFSGLSSGLPRNEPQNSQVLDRSLLGVARLGKSSNGLEDELRTPTTPFFDVDPNLGMEHEALTPRFDSSSFPRSEKKSSSSSSTTSSSNLPPTAFRDPFKREEHSRNVGSVSDVPDLKSLLPSKPAVHRRSSSASSADHSSAGGRTKASSTTPSATNTTSFPSKPQPPPPQQQQVQQGAQPSEPTSGITKPSPLERTSAQPSPNATLLVSPTTSTGTISQRRNKLQGPSSDNSDGSSSNAPGPFPKFAAQNRSGRSDSSPSVPSRLAAVQDSATIRSPSQEERKQPAQVSPGLGSAGRQRAASQPGSKRPSIPAAFMNNASTSANSTATTEVVPPVPRISRKASMPSSLSPTKSPESQLPRQGVPSQPGHFRFPSPIPMGFETSSALPLAEPWMERERDRLSVSAAASSPKAIMNDLFPNGLLSSSSGIASFATSPSTSILPKLAMTSTIPESISSMNPTLNANQSPSPVLPTLPILRPFYLMNQLNTSIRKGGYVTPRLFVSETLWSQSGARLIAVESKVRMMELVSSGIDGIEQAGKTLLLTPTGQPGLAMIQAAKFAKGLEELETLLIEVQNTLAKKLDFLKSVTGKKSNSSFGSIGSKLTRSLDRMTNGSKNLDSPATYVDGLARLFSRSKILESHLQLLIKSQSSSSSSSDGSDSSSPSIEAYAALPKDIRANIESKLKKSSDFFANVVLAFVVRDLGILLDKSVKRNGVAVAE